VQEQERGRVRRVLGEVEEEETVMVDVVLEATEVDSLVEA
jgi:hypothetical protein